MTSGEVDTCASEAHNDGHDVTNDVRCARAIGAKAVAVATGFTSTDDLAASEPDVLVSDLTDTEPVLSLLA